MKKLIQDILDVHQKGEPDISRLASHLSTALEGYRFVFKTKEVCQRSVTINDLLKLYAENRLKNPKDKGYVFAYQGGFDRKHRLTLPSKVLDLMIAAFLIRGTGGEVEKTYAFFALSTPVTPAAPSKQGDVLDAYEKLLYGLSFLSVIVT